MVCKFQMDGNKGTVTSYFKRDGKWVIWDIHVKNFESKLNLFNKWVKRFHSFMTQIYLDQIQTYLR